MSINTVDQYHEQCQVFSNQCLVSHTHRSCFRPSYLPTYLPFYLPIYMPIHLFTYPPIHLSTYPPIHLSTYPPIHLSTYPPIHLSTYQPINLSTYQPIYLLAHLSSYLPIYLFSNLSIVSSHARCVLQTPIAGGRQARVGLHCEGEQPSGREHAQRGEPASSAQRGDRRAVRRPTRQPQVPRSPLCGGRRGWSQAAGHAAVLRLRGGGAG